MDFGSMDVRTLTLLGGGMCTMAAMHFTSQLIGQHLFYWRNPQQQKKIIVVICMAPLYAITSFFGLGEMKQGGELLFTFLDSVKECYEALVIASFLGLLYDYVGISTHQKMVPDEIKGRLIHHSFPMTLFVPKEEKCDVKSLKRLQDWTWQFVVLRPVLSIVVMFLEWMGWYVGPITWIVSLFLNVSVSLAMYSLVLFYHLFHAELAPHKPLAKILCIKGVVFFSFWQGVVLQLLAAAGLLRSEHHWLEVSRIEEAYQNLFVCVEMVAFAVLQQYAFGVQDYSGDLGKLLADAERSRSGKKDH